MPIEEITSGFIRGASRLIVEWFAEYIVELAVRRIGYAIYRQISPDTDPDGWSSLITGLLFWGVILSAGYWFYQYVA